MIVQIKNTGSTFELCLLKSERMEELFRARDTGLLPDVPRVMIEDVECRIEDVWETQYVIDAPGIFGERNSIMAPRPLNVAGEYAILYVDRVEFYEHDQLKITWPAKYFFTTGIFYVKSVSIQ